MTIRLNDYTEISFEPKDFEDNLGSLCFHTELEIQSRDLRLSLQLDFWIEFNAIDKFVIELSKADETVLTSIDGDFCFRIRRDEFFIKFARQNASQVPSKEFTFADNLTEIGLSDLREFFVKFPKWW
ncbi:hypothetical protein [Agrobacterium rosae]|uniref:hypothetical protein n=1 Tax=Agrobacterium rosae TaxID=1972867 RepID=UPI003A7FC388